MEMYKVLQGCGAKCTNVDLPKHCSSWIVVTPGLIAAMCRMLKEYLAEQFYHGDDIRFWQLILLYIKNFSIVNE